MSDIIKERFLPIKELNEEVYDILIHDKIEFHRLARFKKGVKQSLRRYKVGGLRAVFHNPNFKQIINRINTPSRKKKILYITITPSFNLLRQSIYVRKNGNYETILLMESPWLLNLMERHFDAVYIYDTYYELANILKEVKPYLVHVQGSIMGADFLCILVREFSKSRVIFEFYDVPSLSISEKDSINFFGEETTKLGFFAEQFACKNAEGIILSYFNEAAEILKKQYDIKAPILEFYSYPCVEFFEESSLNNKYSFKSKKINLIYTGALIPNSYPDNIYGNYKLFNVTDILTKQNICLNIYTSPYMSKNKFSKLYKEYIDLSNKLDGFKIYTGISPNHISLEASKYDFGTIIFMFKYNNSLDMSNKIKIPTKFFAYLEAGLPIIISEEFEYASKLVREYEIGIVVSQKDMYNLSKIISAYDYKKLRNNVLSARNKLSIETHINRLLQFYEEVVKT
ncbi:MAG: hypothetical protein E3K40_07540 [Candidatus Brocadia sp.]|nr:hypothetical protein [Candidatus Brocadia sp.]